MRLGSSSGSPAVRGRRGAQARFLALPGVPAAVPAVFCTRCGREAGRPHPFPQDFRSRQALLCGYCQSEWDDLVAELATRWHGSFRLCAFCRQPYAPNKFQSNSRFGRGCADCALRAASLFLEDPSIGPPAA